jgi:hypothetical protein
VTQDGWDDERLAAAFRARFDRPAPPAVVASVHDALHGPRRGPASWFRGALVGATGIAAVVVLVIGVALIGLGGFGRSGDTVPPTGSAGPSSGLGGPTSPAHPSSVLGLDVVTVPDALAVRDAGLDDRELAVVGWYAPVPLISCGLAPREQPVSPVQLRCPDERVWLMQDAETLVETSGDRESFKPPVGPALNPDLDDLDRSWEPPPWQVGDANIPRPAHVVLIGHFDDRRSLLCPAAEVTACRDRFVVDRVAWVDGREPPPSQLTLLESVVTARSSVVEIQAIVSGVAPGSEELSMVTVDALGLTRIEPALGTGRRGLIDAGILWVVRVLESERVSTYVVVDGTNAIYEMTADGDAVPVGGSPGPSSSPPSWAPAGSIVIALTRHAVPGAPPAQAAVVDGSGRLIGVSETGSVDLDVTLGPGDIGAFPEPGLPGRVHLLWQGGLCDDRFVVTVAEDLRRISVIGERESPCRLALATWELVLDFSGEVDVDAVEPSIGVTPAGG